MTIAVKNRLTRQQKNISQAELAKHTDINPKTLSRYELGMSISPDNSLKGIANALDVTTDYLISGNNVEIKYKELFKKFEVIQNISRETRKVINKFFDLAIRDFIRNKHILLKNFYYEYKYSRNKKLFA